MQGGATPEKIAIGILTAQPEHHDFPEAVRICVEVNKGAADYWEAIREDSQA